MDVKRGFALHDRIEQAFAIIPQPHSLSVLADEDRQTRSLGSRRGRESGPNRTGSKLDWRLEASNKSRQVWKRLPAPVLELVLQHLNQIHLDRQSPSCTTCYMRDLISVQRTCKAWFSSAQKTLYTHIDIVGQDDPVLLRRWRLSRAARLVRLRSTLRSRPLLAALVKTVNVPDPNIPLYLSNDNPNPAYDAYICTLASVVMTCPNLERFSGFIPFYNHTFDRLTHALSTRTKLRQHVWVIAENDDVRERSQKQLPPGLLDEAQTFQFMLYHQRWKHLETLMLCSPGGLGVIEHSLFQNILHSLPSLRDLGISSFDADDFHDKTLLSIPRVASLRLEECLGVTEAGLTRWAARPRAAAVERLSLIHQNVTSLLTLSKILASLDSLWKFTILQTDVIPTLSVDPGTVVIQPVLASQTLKFLHWDVLCNHQNVHPDAEPNANSRTQSDFNRAREDVGPTANEHLAMSISHNGFPALTHLRVPRDTAPGGALQSVCLPLRDKCTLPENTETPPTSKEGLHSNSLRAARLRALQFAQDRENVSKPPAAEAFELSAESDKVVNYPTDSEASVSTLNTLRSFLTHSSTNTTATNQSHIRSPVSPLDAEQQWMYQIPNPSPNNELLNRRQQDTRASDSAAKRDSICQCEPDAESICTCDGPANSGLDRQRPPTPPRSPLRNSSRLSQSGPFPWDDLNTPYQYQKGETPRQSSSSTSSGTSLPTIQRYKRPIFCLEPDVPGHDANGGLVGWAELLRIREKARMAAGGRGSGHEQEDDDDGDLQERTCTGSWNARFETSDEKRRDWSELELDLVQELTNSNSSSYTLESARSESGTKWRSRLKGKSPSTSRLSLPLRSKAAAGVPLRKTEDKGRHVARPRGERGGCVRVDDFF